MLVDFPNIFCPKSVFTSLPSALRGCTWRAHNASWSSRLEPYGKQERGKWKSLTLCGVTGLVWWETNYSVLCLLVGLFWEDPHALKSSLIRKWAARVIDLHAPEAACAQQGATDPSPLQTEGRWFTHFFMFTITLEPIYYWTTILPLNNSQNSSPPMSMSTWQPINIW